MLKGALRRKLDEWKERKQKEKDIEKKIRNRRYGEFYAQEYEKKLKREIQEKFKPGGSGIGGKFISGIQKARVRGLLKPDYATIDRALYGDPLRPTQPRREKKQHKRSRKSKRGKTIVIRL